MIYFWLFIGVILLINSSWSKAANFSELVLVRDFNEQEAVVKGYTGGAYSLSSIANQDDHYRPCLGYGDTTPDHILILESDLAFLKLQLDSSAQALTLLIKGQDKLLCGDSMIEDQHWSKGRYEIWVGSLEPNQRSTYRLEAQKQN